MVGSGIAEVISSNGCSKMYSDINCTFDTNSSKDLQLPRCSLHRSSSNSPFSGLVICVTGLSKEARKQVTDATERLGGQFSPHLNPKCTHLVVQISFSTLRYIVLLSNLTSIYNSHERKSEYASKHGLFMVTLGWFVDSVTKNVRLNESLYEVKTLGESYMAKDDLKRISNASSCNPNSMLDNVKQSNLIQRSRLHLREHKRRSGSIFLGQTMYIDPDVTVELRNKVMEAVREEGGLVVTEWLTGQNTTHVVCEGSSVRKYIGQSNNLVSPLWVLKTVKEARSQRFVHLSADLARHVGMTMRNVPGGNDQKDRAMNNVSQDMIKSSLKENRISTMLAKTGVRNRRTRASQKPSSPTPTILLDSINWIMSEPSSTAYICSDSFNFNESTKEPDACFVNFLQPLSEREKSELIFGNHFITILFRVDRFREMGPFSRTFFSDTGFTCLQLLHHIYTFYQENMTTSEIELAIHTDSRHADRLRSMYSTKEVVKVKRIDFLGSCKSFQMLKRVQGEHNKNVYELLTRA
ncbi:hypothetical protein LXL04_017911 [Taraxacum kok-saghyz]